MPESSCCTSRPVAHWIRLAAGRGTSATRKFDSVVKGRTPGGERRSDTSPACSTSFSNSLNVKSRSDPNPVTMRPSGQHAARLASTGQRCGVEERQDVAGADDRIERLLDPIAGRSSSARSATIHVGTGALVWRSVGVVKSTVAMPRLRLSPRLPHRDLGGGAPLRRVMRGEAFLLAQLSTGGVFAGVRASSPAWVASLARRARTAWRARSR